MAQKQKQEEHVRITSQYRDKRSMVYELKCDGIRVAISMCEPHHPSTEWVAEATANQLPAPPVLKALGANRAEALRALAEAWRSNAAAGSPPLDWEGIRVALEAVRAV